MTQPSFDLWSNASPDILISATPCTRLHTPLGRAERSQVRYKPTPNLQLKDLERHIQSKGGQPILQLFRLVTISIAFLRNPLTTK